MGLPTGKGDVCDYCHKPATSKRIIGLIDLRTGLTPKMQPVELHGKSVQFIPAKASICRYICNECFPKLTFKIKEKR